MVLEKAPLETTKANIFSVYPPPYTYLFRNFAKCVLLSFSVPFFNLFLRNTSTYRRTAIYYPDGATSELAFISSSPRAESVTAARYWRIGARFRRSYFVGGRRRNEF